MPHHQGKIKIMKETSNRKSFGDGEGSLAVSYEILEGRMLLSAPTFATPLADAYWVPADGSGRTLGIDGSADGGDPLAITAVSDNLLLTVTASQLPNRFALMHFIQPSDSGGSPTAIGDILVQLFEDRVAQGAQRFITLSTDPAYGSSGNPFYHDVVVHRVIPGFMIQTGDAANGNGTGGSPLGDFPDAFAPDLSFAGPGVLAYANSGPDTSDSQFFITAAPYEQGTGTYVIFGQVISGMDVLDQVINVPRDTTVDPNTGMPKDRPYNPPLLESVQIINSPQDGTITMVAQPGLTGAAHVTVTLDDGHGNRTPKVLTVRSMADLGQARPVIVQPGDIRLAPGQTTTFTATVTDDGILPLDLAGATDVTTGSVSADSATKVVTITAPQNFSGMMKVRLSAVESGGWSDLDPGYQMVYVMVTGPLDPPFLDRLVPAGGSAAVATVQYGNWLLSADGTAGLSVYDVGDAANPIKVNTYDTNGWARSIKVARIGATDVAFVADTGGGLLSLDVTDPTQIVALGAATLPVDQTQTYGSLAVDVVISGNMAWVAGFGGGAFGYDVSDPTNMRLACTLRTPSAQVTIGAAVSVAINGQFLYVSDPDGAIIAANVSDPANPTVASVFGQGYAPWGIDISGNTLFMADNKSLVSWNVTNPSAPKKIGQLAMTGAWIVQVEGGLAIVSHNGGYSLVNVSNPRKMVQTYFYAALDLAFNYMGYSGMPSIGGNVISLPLGANGVVLLRGAIGVSNGTASFRDAGGVLVKFKVSKGSALLTTTGMFSGNIQQMEIAGTPSTTVSISTKGGATTIGGDVIVAGGSLKSFSAKTTNLNGDFTVDGSISSLVLRDVAGGMISVKGTAAGANAAAAPAMTFAQVNGAGIDTPYYVKSITAQRWIGGTIDAGSIGSLSVKGARGVVGDLTVEIDAASIKSLSVKHDMLASILDLTGPYDPANPKFSALGKLTVSGRLDATEIRSAGNIGSVSAVVFHDSTIFAGVNSLVTELPLARGDFLSLDDSLLPTIGSIKAKGLTGQMAFDNSNVAAWTIKKVSIKTIQTDNGGHKFGLAGRTVKPYVAPVAPQGDFEVRLI